MNRILRYYIGAVLLCAGYRAGAQGMAVNTTGAAANSSAILDVSSTSKGVLVPRMTGAQKWAISSPATGLMVYQTDSTPGFCFYTGSAWASVNAYTNVTTQGNSFNGANQLVQTNSSSLVSSSNLGTGIADSTKFLRGNNTWAAPIACGNIRTVTSNTTLNSSDQIIFCNGSTIISLTLFSPSLAPKGYQLNLSTSSNTVLLLSPSGTTQIGLGGSFTLGSFSYYANLVSDGNNTWYWIQGR